MIPGIRLPAVDWIHSNISWRKAYTEKHTFMKSVTIRDVMSISFLKLDSFSKHQKCLTYSQGHR